MNSWFEIHYNDPLIPDNYFKEQLWVRKETFEVILNHLNHLTRQDTTKHDCIPPEKVLAIGLHRLGHGNSYMSIGPTFNIGKTTVIEAVQDVVNALFDASDQFIKFPIRPAETAASIETFCDHTFRVGKCCRGNRQDTQKLSHPMKMRLTNSVVISNTISLSRQ